MWVRDVALVRRGSGAILAQGGSVLSARSETLLVLTFAAVWSAVACAAGTIPAFEKRTVAPILHAVTPSVVNISTRKVEVVDNPMLRDPVSAFGGIVALNRRLDAEAARGSGRPPAACWCNRVTMRWWTTCRSRS